MSTETDQQETASTPMDPGKRKEIEEKIVEVLKTCYDPEIPVDIYELGLIYDIGVKSEDVVHVKMTLTSPMCPVAESLPPEVERKIKTLPEIKTARVDVVWDPPWAPTMMSEAAKLQLNMM
jgi:FeS assembly SUF system protein